MSYLNRAQDPRRRATAIAGVVAIHAAIGFVLVTGLQATGIISQRTIVDTFDVKETPPPPPPVDEVIPEPSQAPDFIAPKPPVDLSESATIKPREFDPLVIPDPVVVPEPGNLVEPPRPQPSFAPKRATPHGDTSRWVTTEDYPSSALRREAEGTTHFRLVIGTDGKVDACEVTRSSGDAQLDAATCRNIERRARFEPATDGNGQKVVGTYSNAVTWQIPD